MTKKYKINIRDKRGTLVIILINMMIFIALNTIPDIGDKLLLDPKINIIMKRPWTLVTVFFSHEILIHIFANMGLLLCFGSRLEKITSSKIIFAVYLTCGFVGSLTIIPVAYLNGFSGLIPGASASVFGIVATFAAMRPNTKVMGGTAKQWAAMLFAFNAVLWILKPQISIGGGAHAIGIVIGLIFGYYLKNKETKRSNIGENML
ncbi:rhomboid family intramembrane serine protease [Clostridium sp. D2Q-11]|uniref:Rhomboid family intramembrane serine protease n=2 Tax=Anaeromonas frigoriresistens TaxID=2683708 RepID=A0A942Z9L1_9FIRM|nr:rhomboid family intramembrane serine protease [Anaeromonas frigoriresistens]